MRTPYRSFRTRLLTRLGWILAFAAPPLLVGQHNARAALDRLREPPPPPPAAPAPSIPIPDLDRPVAVLLAGDGFTEATDLLGPYELLAASGVFQTYVLAWDRSPRSLFPGTLDILPHFSLTEWDTRVGRVPELIVLPYMEGGGEAAHAELEAWLRRNWSESNLLVTICGGSYIAAAAGLLDGRTATSHRNILRIVEDAHPEVEWRSGVRYVDDGNLVSSAGITAGIDAVLHVLSRTAGRDVAMEVAAGARYPHLHHLEDPSFRIPRGSNLTPLLNAAFLPSREVGVLLQEGASELHLAALTDTYPRTLVSRLVTMAHERGYVATRHGLHVVPRWSVEDAPPVDRLFRSGSRIMEGAAAPQDGSSPVGAEGGPPGEPLETGAFPYDRLLDALARDLGSSAAMAAARGLEYPIREVGSLSSLVPFRAVRNALLLGLLGVAAGVGLRAGMTMVRRGGGSGRGGGASTRRGAATATLSAALLLGSLAWPHPGVAAPLSDVDPSSGVVVDAEVLGDPQDAPTSWGSEEVAVPVSGAILLGRLLLPARDAPHPAAVLLAGARNSRNLPGVAEYLAARGVAVLDLDKRGVGGSSGSWRGETFDQRTEDALAAIRLLREHPRIDAQRIGVVGHSQGGYVAPMVAVRDPALAFVVLLAGPGQTVRDQVLTHRRTRMTWDGESPEAIEREVRGLRRQLSVAAAVQGPCRTLRLSYLCGMIDHDPEPFLSTLDAPVLALFAAFDDMVPPDVNIPLVQEALDRAPGRDVTIRVFPEGCHDFMPQSGPTEPMGEGFLPGFLETLGDWIDARIRAPGAGIPEDVQGSPNDPARGGATFLPMPILYRSQETGWAGGLALTRVGPPLRTGSPARPAAVDEATIVFTEEGQYLGVLATDRYVGGDRLRLFGRIEGSHFPSVFHGVGRDLSPSVGESYTSRRGAVSLGTRWTLGRGIQVGGGLGFARYAVAEADPQGRLRSGETLGGEGGTVASATLAVGRDTRDAVSAARSGSHVEVRVRGAESVMLGDFPFSQLTFDARRYLPVRGDHLLAAQLLSTSTWGSTPFQELPTMGGPHLMRGYHPHLERDRTVNALQVEYRSPFFWRLGGVLFGGAGAVTDSWSDAGRDAVRWSGGGGMRFALDPHQRLHLRVDYAVGRRSSSLYFGIGEVF